MYYTGKEISSFLQNGIKRVKLLVRHFNKLKIASYSSYADTASLANVLVEQLFPIILDDDIDLVIVSKLNDKIFEIQETYLFPGSEREAKFNTKELVSQANSVTKSGVKTLSAGEDKFLMATIVKDQYRYQFIGGNQRNNMFEYIFITENFLFWSG